MIKTSIAINIKYNDQVKKKIESYLSGINVYDIIYYYYSPCKNIDYTMFFFRGKETVSHDYVKLLTNSFKTKGIYLRIDFRSVNFEFYKDGNKLFNFITSHPDSINLEGSFNVERKGDINILSEYNKDININDIEKIIHGDSIYFFQPSAYVKTFFSKIGLSDLSPMSFWGWESLTGMKSKYKNLDWSKKNGEFSELIEATIKPGYR